MLSWILRASASSPRMRSRSRSRVEARRQRSTNCLRRWRVIRTPSAAASMAGMVRTKAHSSARSSVAPCARCQAVATAAVAAHRAAEVAASKRSSSRTAGPSRARKTATTSVSSVHRAMAASWSATRPTTIQRKLSSTVRVRRSSTKTARTTTNPMAVHILRRTPSCAASMATTPEASRQAATIQRKRCQLTPSTWRVTAALSGSRRSSSRVRMRMALGGRSVGRSGFGGIYQTAAGSGARRGSSRAPRRNGDRWGSVAPLAMIPRPPLSAEA